MPGKKCILDKRSDLCPHGSMKTWERHQRRATVAVHIVNEKQRGYQQSGAATTQKKKHTRRLIIWDVRQTIRSYFSKLETGEARTNGALVIRKLRWLAGLPYLFQRGDTPGGLRRRSRPKGNSDGNGKSNRWRNQSLEIISFEREESLPKGKEKPERQDLEGECWHLRCLLRKSKRNWY